MVCFKHGLMSLPEYHIWRGIRFRCFNPNSRGYHNYGGRGITVSPEWDDFTVFYRDIGARPTPDHQIDRIDVNGNYCKENTRWATPKENSNNKRTNRLLTFNGETKTMEEWVEATGLTRAVIKGRLKYGWSLEKIFTSPPTTPQLFTFNGENKTMKEWAEATGMTVNTFKCRLRNGWTVEKILSTPWKARKSRKQKL